MLRHAGAKCTLGCLAILALLVVGYALPGGSAAPASGSHSSPPLPSSPAPSGAFHVVDPSAVATTPALSKPAMSLPSSARAEERADLRSVSPALAANIFPPSVDLSASPASGEASGGPPSAPDPQPSIAEDSTGTIYVAWAANDTTTGHWLIYFSKSSDGTSFSAPVVVGPTPGTNVNDVSPSIAVKGSGATAYVAIVYETMTGYIGYGGYEYMLSENGGSSFTAEGTNSHAGDTEIYSPVAAWIDTGSLLIAYWGFYAEATCSSDYGNVISVDTWDSAGTAYDASGYWCGLAGTNSVYVGVVSLACSPSGADCSFLYSASDSAGTLFEVIPVYSANSFATSAAQGATLTSATFASSDQYVTAALGSNDLAYTGAATAIAAYATDSGNPTPYAYVLGYASTANNWGAITAYSTPAAASVFGGAIATDGSGNVVLSWEDVATNTVQTAWAPAAGGTMTTANMLAPGSLGESPSASGTTSTSPFRLDFVWVNESTSPTTIYYTHFIGLGGTATATPKTVDLWTPVSFTATPTNGAPAYSYAWSFGGACSPACPTTTQNPTVNYTSAGSYAVSVTITDSIGETATASAGTITVNPRLLVSLSPATASIDPGQALTFTATATGGSASYSSYAWMVNGVAQASTISTMSYTFGAAGTDNVAVTVTDSLGITSPGAGAVITVGSPLVLSGIKATPDPTTPGTTVTFTSTVSGGTSPYTYAWSLGGGLLSSAASPTNSYSASGNYTIYLNLTDASAGTPPATASATTYVLIDSAMTVSAAAAPASPVVGQTVFLNATATGGTPAYTYSWVFGDGIAGAGQFATHAYSASGTFTATLFVNDSVKQLKTATVKVTVLPALSITASGNPNPGTAGTAVSFSSTATGGSGSYTYAWTFGDGTTSTSASPTHTYSTAGSYNVDLTVTDTAGHTASAPFTETVNKPGGSSGSLTISLTPTLTSVVVNGLETFDVTVTGGDAVYAFSWNFGDGHSAISGPSASPSTETHTYTATGTYTVRLSVNDTSNPVNTGTATTSVTVLPATSFTDSLEASHPNVDVGETVDFTGAASGGSGTYTAFLFTFGDGTASNVPVSGAASQESAQHAYTTPGTYIVYLNVTDTSTPVRTASASLEVIVHSKVLVAVSAPASSVDANSNTIFTATASGGSGVFDGYAWTFGSMAQISGSQQQAQTFSAPGLVMIVAAVTDTYGGVGYGFMNLTVNPPVAVTVTGSPNNQPAPMCVSFVATASGGLGPYQYAWTFGDGSSAVSTTDNWTHCYQTPGLFDASVIVTDSVGGTATGWLNSTAAANHSPGVVGEVFGNWWWLLIVLVAVAALLLLLIVRRRRPPASPEAEMFYGGGGAVMMGGAAVGAVPIDDLAPAVPLGSSDQSPDDLGGVEDGSAGASATASLPAAAPMGELGQGGAPSHIPSCPRCGAALMGEGLPCPSCQYVASADELAAAAAATTSPRATAPSPDTLSHCPQCAGPLAPDNSCPICQVRWEPSAASAGGSGIGVLPSSGTATPLATAQGPSQELTHCPQCGTVLSAGRICSKCQVSWEPHAQSPSGLSGSPGTTSGSSASSTEPAAEEFPVPPPPEATEVRRGSASSPSAMDESSLPPTEASTPAPMGVTEVPRTPVELPKPSAPAAPAPAAAPPTPAPLPPTPPAAPAASSPPSTPTPQGPGRTRCFICDGPLENGFCASCNMSWSD